MDLFKKIVLSLCFLVTTSFSYCQSGQFEALHLAAFSENALEAYLFNLYPQARYHIYMASFYGDLISFEDGSEWMIAPRDRSEAVNWHWGQAVFLTQSNCPSCGSYMLLNEERGTVVYANRLTEPRSWNSFLIKRITHIDHFYKRIALSDGSWWNMAFVNESIVNRWMIGHKMLIGLNSAQSALIYPFILINLGTNGMNISSDEYVEAQLSY